MAWIKLEPSHAVMGVEKEREREQKKKRERKKDRRVKAESRREGGRE